jgi:moderate conductance mechanosensitive channel
MAGDGYLYDLLREAGLSELSARTGELLLVRPMKIVLLIVLGAAVGRLGARASRRFVQTVHRRSPLRPMSPRAEQRAGTVADVLGNAIRMAVWAVVLLIALGEVGIELAPLIAGAGVAGVAIGFGAQSLVRDYISGIFILTEDQYGVGDIVTLGDTMGTVEDVSLRVTRLRAVDGTVWFVPNGEIRKVGNSSMEWSRALLDVQVAYGTDVAAASAAIAEEARAMALEEQWRELVLDEPEVWGVQAMDKEGITIRLVVRTAPRQQYAIARELRTRISERLRRDGVKGPGQMVLVTAGSLDSGSPPPPPPDEVLT